MNPLPSSEITRVMLLVVVIGALLTGSFLTLRPFIGAVIWATTIVVATWPVLLLVQRHTGNRRGTAVAIMTIVVVLAVLLPLVLATGAVINAAQHVPAVVREFAADGLGPAPQWLDRVPIVGERLTAKWQAASAAGPEAVIESMQPYARSAASWVFAATGGLGGTALYLLITVIVVGILYAQGETAARGLLAFGYRLGRERGEETIRLAGQAVRSVALGVLVTAFVQAFCAGLGLWASGVPRAGLLAACAFALAIMQIGPILVLIPAIIWLYATDQVAWGTALLIWSIPVIAMDNVLRPVLIKRGVQLPMLLIIAGVIGGLISFGVVGLFIGPVILAATYTLAKSWVTEGWPDKAPQPSSAAEPTPSAASVTLMHGEPQH